MVERCTGLLPGSAVRSEALLVPYRDPSRVRSISGQDFRSISQGDRKDRRLWAEPYGAYQAGSSQSDTASHSSEAMVAVTQP